MKFRRFISILLGLGLIAGIVYKFIEIDINNTVVYLDQLGDLGNTIFVYVFLAIKILAIVLLSIGLKKPMIAGFVFLILSVAEYAFLEYSNILNMVNDFMSNMGAYFKPDGLPDFFYLFGLVLMVVYLLFFVIFLGANKFEKKGVKITMIILGLLPIALFYVGEFIAPDAFEYNFWVLIDKLQFEGLTLFMSLVILLGFKTPKKPEGRHVWFPNIDTF